MIEKKYEELKEKIKNKNLSLDNDDEIVLKLYPELYKEIIVLLSENIEYWNDKIADFIFNEDTINLISPEVKDNFWINYIRYAIMKEVDLRLTENELEEFFFMIGIKEEAKEIIRNLVSKQIKNSIEERKLNANENDLSEALKEKRYDLIAQIETDMYSRELVSEELSKRLINEFPYDEFETPIFFAAFPELVEDKLEKLSLKTIINLIYKQEYDYGDKYIIPKERLFNALKEKIKEKKLEEPSFLKERIINIESLIPSEIINEISEITLNNNILDFVINYYANNPDKREFCCNKLLEFIDKTDKIEYFYKIQQIVEDNEILVDKLIEKGFILELINSDCFKNYPNKIPSIIDSINNGNPKYKKNSRLEITPSSLEYLNVIEALINKGFIQEISVHNIFSLDTKLIDYFAKIIREYSTIKINGLSSFRDNIGIEKIVIEYLLKKKYNEVLELINTSYYDNRKIFTQILKENKDLIISSLEDSIYFAKGLIKNSATEIFENKEILEIFFKEPFLSKELIEYLNHHEELEHLYNHETFIIAKDSFVKNYKINEERLVRFEQKFGPKIIRYINNDNILKILNLNEKDFEKFMNLFPNVEYTMQDLESAYDSLKQYEFSKTQPNIITIFPTILHAIEDNNNEIIINSINDLYPCLDKPFFRDANKKYEFPQGYDESNPKLFVTFIIEKIKNSEGEKKEKYIEILHEITDYYISRKRGEYRETYDMIGELRLSYTLEEKSIEREFLKELIERSYHHKINYIVDNNGEIKHTFLRLSEYLAIKLEKYGLDKNLINELIRYYNLKNRDTYSYPEETLKNNYKYLIKAINEIYKEKPLHECFSDTHKNSIISYLDANNRLKRKHNPGPIGLDIYEILTNLRVDVIEECILNNDEIYTSLENLMNKKKIHLLPKSLKKILSNSGINISDDFNNLAAFISYYAQIYSKEKSTLASNNKPTDNININLTNILINAEVYSGISNVYSQILGNEDAKLIKANPGPNSATQKLANDGRLKEAIELTEKLYRRQSVTIPTFNENLSISNDKSLRVIAGNFTHPSNLTHGERTGACMRIGGVGESLFQFAIDNPNGFHIRFEDPNTGKYISRVTGFRNGNTVFLNELRNSCDPDAYTDEEIIEACKKAGEQLIGLSKDSTCPIENVVVHRAYATTNMKERNTQLNVKNIKEGLPSFYTDVNSCPIILATTAKNGKFTPVDLKNDLVPSYLPARENPGIYKEEAQANNKINRVASIKRLLDGENYEYIAPLEFENGLIYAIVSDDWYIYVDEHGNIHKDCIDIDPRAKEELAEYLIKLETELNNNPIKKEETYGF